MDLDSCSTKIKHIFKKKRSSECEEVCPLALTVKAAVFYTILKQFAVRLHGRTENKHTRVETVGPARVRSS